MAGKNGYVWTADRVFEDLTSLKKNARLQGRVQEVRFSHVAATGGGGAAIEIEEKTGVTISRLTTGNEAQVYVRTSTDAAGYQGKAVALEYLNEDGVVKSVTGTFDGTDSTDEEALVGATDFYRLRSWTSAVTPGAGHSFSIGDADHAADGSGNDAWGMIEENNYGSIHSRYYVPVENSDGKTMYGYLGKMRAKYFTTNNDQGEPIEYCTLTVTCTPADLGYETQLLYKIYVGDTFEWESPFRLEGATDTVFTVTDDAATGGSFEFEYVIVEVTRLV
jgi:hypothetical protein